MNKAKNKNIRIVVKVEIPSMLCSDGTVNTRRIDKFAMTLSNLNNSGKQIIVVSSGAIALGSLRLGLQKQPDMVISKQAIAAVGQAELTRMYKKYFNQYNQIIAQVLLTNDVVNHDDRKRNARNTFKQLLKMNIIPVVNENDAVSIDDINTNDNYWLALNVAEIAVADLIIIKENLNGEYIIVPRGKHYAIKVKEENLAEKIDEYVNLFGIESKSNGFPKTMDDILKSVN